MSKWLLGLCIVAIGGVMVVQDVEARRMGGGRSTGIQRNVTPPPQRPAQQQAAPNQQQQAVPGQQAAAGGAAAAAPAASGLSRWMPMLGGLALGGMLGYLFGGSGMMGMLLLAALAIGVVFVIRALMRRHAPQAPRPMQYAGMGNETDVAPPPSQSIGLPAQGGASQSKVPAGFDTPSFLRGAKLNFMRLQAANDEGRLDEIRDLATNEMFETLKADVAERGGARQQTDIDQLDASLLEVATEGDKHSASVHFSGRARETPGAIAVPFQEVWHLTKPADGSTGWLLAGIQQMQ